MANSKLINNYSSDMETSPYQLKSTININHIGDVLINIFTINHSSTEQRFLSLSFGDQ